MLKIAKGVTRYAALSLVSFSLVPVPDEQSRLIASVPLSLLAILFFFIYVFLGKDRDFTSIGVVAVTIAIYYYILGAILRVFG